MVDFDVPAAVAASRKLNAVMVRFVPSNILRTPEQGDQGQPGAATNEHREKYRKLAQERLEAERGLIVD